MARPKKNTVDYFPHDCIKSREISVIQKKFDSDGYRLYYELMELLGRTPDHTLKYDSPIDKLYVAEQLGVEVDFLDEVFKFMYEIKVLHQSSFEAGYLFSEELINRVKTVYDKRKTEIPVPPCQDLDDESRLTLPTMEIQS